MKHVWPLVLALVLGAHGPYRAAAQLPPASPAATGSLTLDRARLDQILGVQQTSVDATVPRWFLVRPLIRLVRNTDIPYSGNDGAMWAGRGINSSFTAGVGFHHRMGNAAIDVVLAPTATYSANRPFTFLPGADSTRSAYASPWHIGQSSMDLPVRFGDRSLREVSLGESFVALSAGPITVGASTASEWWGPAIRNTLLLSNNAAGIPRGFVRTTKPLRSRIGSFSIDGFVGALTESRFFDTVPSNTFRSINGVRVAYRPAVDSNVTVGVARLVTAPIRNRHYATSHGFDALTSWHRLVLPGDTLPNGASTQRDDQLLELFVRWVFPESGFETYVEWARIENPRSLNELFTNPQNTQGYTIGLQWIGDTITRGGRLRVQGEMTYVEQTSEIPGRPSPDFYSGRAVQQGWTNQGQVLGAFTGPGSSAQFVGADWIARQWQLGAFAGHTRWENDALYRTAEPRLTQHDATIYSGIRGGIRTPWSDVAAELTVGRRLNYLFQNDAYNPDARHAVDVQNVTLAFVLSPR